MLRQSDPSELRKNIERLMKTDTGVYSFFWAHPIKIPVEKTENDKVDFWDRRNDVWITLEPVILSPRKEDFKESNISLIPDEPDVFCLIGTFKFIIQKIDNKWTVKVTEVIV